MDQNIDLSEKREKSVMLIITGILLFCFPVFILLWRALVPSAHSVPVLDTIAYSILFIGGAGLVIAGSGRSPARIFSKIFLTNGKSHKSV